jgi:hypothetical protein
MKELERKDAPDVTGGIVGPVPIPVVKPILPIHGPDFPPNPLGGPEQPAVEKYLT